MLKHMTFLSRLLTLVGLLALSHNGFGQTTLQAGDIAIVGFAFDNPDEISFVTLVDLEANTVIKFTDKGWLSSDDKFRSNEGVYTWTTNTTINAGTIISEETSGVNFPDSGEQIIVFQGSVTSPTLIYALNSEGSTGVWQSNATSSNTSALPTGLTNGENAMAFIEKDNGKYLISNGLSGTKSEILNLITDTANWETSNSRIDPSVSFSGVSFTVNQGGAQPAVTTTGTISNFGNTNIGNTSTSQSISVSGSDLQGNISVAVSGDFEISTNDSTFSTTDIPLTPSNGSVGSTLIYVRFAPTAPSGAKTGALTISSSGVSDQTVTLNGTAVAVTPEVNFVSTAATKSEADGSFNLEFSITNPDNDNATNFNLELTSGTAADINNFSTQSLSFAAGSSDNITYPITITDDSEIETDETLVFTITNTTTGANSTFTLTITDNDTPDDLLSFDFNGNTGSESTASSNSNHTNILAATISRGDGLNASNNGDRFNATSWSTGDLTAAENGGDYMEFTMSSAQGFQLKTYDIAVNFQRSGTGVRKLALKSSADNYTSVIDGVKSIADVDTTTTVNFLVNATAASASVTYRIYGYEAESSGGSGGFEGSGNDILVRGTTEAVSCSSADDVSNLSATAGTDQINLSWSNGLCYDEIMVVAKANSVNTTVPSGDGSSYTANTVYSSGTTIETDAYVVYKGTSNSTVITGLDNNTIYYLSVYARLNTNWSSAINTNIAPVATGDLIITEVSGEFTDNDQDDDGFIEIKNTSAVTKHLNGVTVNYFNGNSDNNIDFTIALSGTIAPGAYITATRDNTAYNAEYGVDADFNNSLFYFNGGPDRLSITLTDNTEIDAFNDTSDINNAFSWDFGVAYYRINESASGALRSSWRAVGFATPKAETTFDAELTTTGTWATTSNWKNNIAPTTSDNIILPDLPDGASGTVTLNSDFTANSIYVGKGYTLNISKTGSLITNAKSLVYGKINLESDHDAFASFIMNSSLVTDEDSSNEGSVTYSRYIAPSPVNDLISPMLSGQTPQSVITANSNIYNKGTLAAFGSYNATNKSYDLFNLTDNTTSLSISQGYILARTAGSVDKFVEFTGTPNRSNKTFETTQGGWQLVGNPYTAYIKVSDFITANSGSLDASYQFVYGYNTYNSGTTKDTWSNYNGSEDYIAPGQGFYVYTKTPDAENDYNITFQASTRTTEGGDDFNQSTNRNTSQAHKLGLALSNGSQTTSTYFVFDAQATLDVDPGKDAGAFTAVNGNQLQLYSRYHNTANNVKLGTQALPLTSEENIPLEVYAAAGTALEFNATSINANENLNVYLVDALNNTYTNLSKGERYSFTTATALEGAGRFYMAYSTNALHQGSFNAKQFVVYQQNQHIEITGALEPQTTIRLIDQLGRIITTKTLIKPTQKVTLNANHITPGVYMVQLAKGHQQLTKKVIVN
jgi:hypothetical protein